MQRRPLKARWFVVLGALSIVVLLAGLAPAYRYDHELRVGAVSRCPPPPGSEGEFDQVCAQGLLRYGPLGLATPAVAVGFIGGLVAVVGLLCASRRTSTRITSVVLASLFIAWWTVMLVGNSNQIDRHAGGGWTILSLGHEGAGPTSQAAR